MGARCRCRPTALVAALAAVVVTVAMLPALAGAFLPDGRIYEQASPPYKNGNVVSGGTFGLASADGNAVMYIGSGAMGAAYSSNINEFDSHRTPYGWTTVSAIPRQQSAMNFWSGPQTVTPSNDFTRFLFASLSRWVSSEPVGPSSSSNIFLSEDPALEASWIAQPTIADAIPTPGNNKASHDYLVSGQSPDLSTVYFTYSGTLLPGDAGRAAHLVGGEGRGEAEPWGFYEWNHGRLGEAGTLPDGSLSAYGAVPAAIAGLALAPPAATRDGGVYQAEMLDNEVSEDGSRAFFVSPDPLSSTLTDPSGCNTYPGRCTSEPPELYLREAHSDGSHTVELVSRSELAGSDGQPAPHGASEVPNAPNNGNFGKAYTFVFASPDGSQAFFTSTDRLTQAAPGDETVKEYDFDVSTGTLTYLPGVTGGLVAASRDGLAFIYENTVTTPHEIDLWTAGPGGGSVRTVTQLPYGQPPNVNAGRVSDDGSVFLFRTNATVAGFNNAGGFQQIYRYDVAAERLDCVSCPPEGVTPSGDVNFSYNNAEEGKPNGYNAEPMTTLDSRVISSDGSRVFFDTPDALLSRDTNGRRDVYQWESGQLYLISSGGSAEDSFVIDSSASGDDVFFVTSSGLATGDTDSAYDAYDARIPRPGDTQPPASVPCQGDVCQGPPSVPSLLGLPASATFDGAGNASLSPSAHVTPKSLTRGQKLARALRACRHRKSARGRAKCRRGAQRRYGASAASVRLRGKAIGHNKGRGK
jgi:hypothetical protein